MQHHGGTAACSCLVSLGRPSQKMDPSLLLPQKQVWESHASRRLAVGSATSSTCSGRAVCNTTPCEPRIGDCAVRLDELGLHLMAAWVPRCRYTSQSLAERPRKMTLSGLRRGSSPWLYRKKKCRQTADGPDARSRYVTVLRSTPHHIPTIVTRSHTIAGDHIHVAAAPCSGDGSHSTPWPCTVTQKH